MQDCYMHNNIFPCPFFLQSLAPTSLENTMRTVKILALEFSVADLDATIGVLRCFPCIEKLYVNFMKWLDIPVNKHVHPTDPVKCPEINLKVKELVLNNYKGSEQDVCFAKFFLLNSKVLKKIRLGIIQKIHVLKNREIVTNEWKDHRDMLLKIPSPQAILKFKEEAAGKGLGSAALLLPWMIWKHRNECVFEGARPSVRDLMSKFKEEAALWAKAGAMGLRVWRWSSPLTSV
ncbi:uncharacterized protein LOC124660578 isoform X3 [Lolium rigidum]|uniref:uncharacterized protein LOC124660578 isoform X3 n=1 Tax=Lolium rigidum TaxID=89674 RepID=UPI001F5C61B2|nr:uncharacterized protein LOC124660578 isoform X3 [Lolium rigidum]